MAAPVTVSVGGHSFTTLRSTLDRSPLLAVMLSDRWMENTAQFATQPFIDRNHVLFEHILDFLRTSFPPIFWSRDNGFDLPLYAALLQEADYFQLPTLADWIREEKYIYAIRITLSIDQELLTDCRRGLTWYSANVEKEFDSGTVSTASNSGRSTTHWKRVHTRTTKLCPPVSGNLLISTLLSTNIRFLGESVINYTRNSLVPYISVVRLPSVA